jgi:hypothetical protein
MPASFAGVVLNLADPGGAVQAWCDRYRPLDDVVPVCTPAAYRDGRDRPQGNWPHSVGLPVFNWIKRPPRWRINSLWWPTGASRFSIGLFLTTLAGANAIKTAVGSNGSGTLALNDGSRSISVTMYLLPPRPIGAVGTDNPVVIIPLVDQRYYWQFAHMGQSRFSPSSAWADVRAAITANLGAAVSASDPAAGYQAPDWSEWTRFYENAGLALDAYAATVGQRLIAGLDGTYFLQMSGNGFATCNTNLANLAAVAGGACLTSPGSVPSNLAVAFLRRQGGVPHQSGACDLVTKAASNYGFGASIPGTAVIHTTYQADYSQRQSQADNSSSMDSLADAIAADFYRWKQNFYSATSPGIANGWSITGFDDYLWFLFGTQVGTIEPCDCDEGHDVPESFRADEFEKPSPYLAQTLIESLPPNFGVEENLAQTPAGNYPQTFRPVPICRAELTGSWNTQGNTPVATARLLYANENPSTGRLVKDGFNVQLFDTMSLRGTTKSGSRAWVAALPSDTEMFELVSGMGSGAALIVFELTGVLGLGGFSDAVECELDAAQENYVPTTQVVTVVDPFSNPGCWLGFPGYRGIGRLRTDGFYDVVFMERPALVIEYELYEDFNWSGQQDHVLATVLAYYQHGNKRINAANPYQVSIYDPLDLNSAALRGERGLAIWNDDRVRYEFLGGSSLYELVTVDGGQQDGALLNSDVALTEDELGSRVFNGWIVRPTNVGVLDLVKKRPCWVAFADWGFESSTTNDLIAVQGKVYGPAKFMGMVTAAGPSAGRRPLFMATIGDQEWEATSPVDWVKGDLGQFVLLDRFGNQGPTLPALLKWGDYIKNKKAVVKLMNGLLVAKQAECD